MAEDEQGRAPHGGLSLEITVEEPPARVTKGPEPVETQAEEPQAPETEARDAPGPEQAGPGQQEAGKRLKDLIGKLREKARPEPDGQGVEPDEASEARAPQTGASGFTILAYRSGDGDDATPPIPGRQASTSSAPPEVEAPEEPEEGPGAEEEAPEPEEPSHTRIESAEEDADQAPAVPSDDGDAGDEEAAIAIEMAEPEPEVTEPETEIGPGEEAAAETPAEAEEIDEAEDDGSPGFLAGLRSRFSRDTEPDEEAPEVAEPGADDAGEDSPGLLTRLRSKLSRSRVDAIETPGGMPAPPPTPPVAAADVETTDQPEADGQASTGLFSRLRGKLSRADDDQDPAPEPEPATAEVDDEPDEPEAPAEQGGFLSRLKAKVSRAGSKIQDPAGAELRTPPTPPTGDRQPGIIASLGRGPQPRVSDIADLEETLAAAEAEEEPEPDQAQAPEASSEPEPAEEPDKETGGLFSRLKSKVTGSADQEADEQALASTPIVDPIQEDAVQGGPKVPPTGDRHPEMIAAMTAPDQEDQDPEEPEPMDAEEPEEVEDDGGLFSRLKAKVSRANAQKADDGRPEEATEPDQPPVVAADGPEVAGPTGDDPVAPEEAPTSKAQAPPEPTLAKPRVQADVDEATEPSEAEGELPYDELVRRVEALLERRREDPGKSAAGQTVRVLAGGKDR